MSGGDKILVERAVSPMKLEVLGVDGWPLVAEQVAVESREYPRTEETYIVAGRAEITADDGGAVEVGEGDLVTFMPGAKCRWNITAPMQRHTRSGSGAGA